MSSPFGYRRSPFTRARRFHEGVDIRAPRGTPILSSAEGVVTRAGYKGGLGRTVEIDHGSGVSSVYGHASRIFVRPGQCVPRGAVIASVGNSGRSTGPHLHFEVRVEGIPLDPMASFFREI